MYRETTICLITTQSPPMEMTPRQRWMALLSGNPADRVPTDYQATEEVTTRLLEDLDCTDEESLYRRLHVDARRFVEPKWLRREATDDAQVDMYKRAIKKILRSEIEYHRFSRGPMTGTYGSSYWKVTRKYWGRHLGPARGTVTVWLHKHTNEMEIRIYYD